jgi:transposase InsO family protein
MASHPFGVTSDNGKEFVSKEFIAILKAHGIKHHRTKPYFPWEHGKIECSWPTSEKAHRAGNSVMEILDEYNNLWPHSALSTLTSPTRDATPADAWSDWERWTGQEDAKNLYS